VKTLDLNTALEQLKEKDATLLQGNKQITFEQADEFITAAKEKGMVDFNIARMITVSLKDARKTLSSIILL
jgi:hypothetical protein